MKIIIAGAGVIGANLAESLAKEDHEVYLIERDSNLARKIDEKLDVKVITGDGADPDSLKKAGVEQADLVVAVTTSDETNLVVSSLAAAYGAKRRIARVRSPSLKGALGEFGYAYFNIDEIINPEQLAAHAIVKAIEAPGTREVADFANSRLLLRSFDVPVTSPLCGMQIGNLKDEHFPWPFLIIAIARNRSFLIPKGDTFIEASDHIYVFLPPSSLGEFLTFVDPNIRKPRKVVIYGATNTGESVTEKLANHIKDITLLEEDAKKAEEAAGRLESVRVINGSASEADILKECGIEAADAFVAASHNDNANLVSAVLAKKMGAKTTIITTGQPDYVSIVETLDIDAIINPRLLAVAQILRIVRGKGISSVSKFIECNAEALELIPEKNSPITKAPIKDINFPKDSIVGAVCRDPDVILANGDTHIMAGEKVIVFCQEASVKKLQRLFTR